MQLYIKKRQYTSSILPLMFRLVLVLFSYLCFNSISVLIYSRLPTVGVRLSVPVLPSVARKALGLSLPPSLPACLPPLPPTAGVGLPADRIIFEVIGPRRRPSAGEPKHNRLLSPAERTAEPPGRQCGGHGGMDSPSQT